MRISKLEVSGFPPIHTFSVDDPADVVVLGGPNGVGKTRLLEAILMKFRKPTSHPHIRVCVTATAADERADWGGRKVLDTGNPDEALVLQQILQRPQRRGRIRSGVLNFDSSRAFEQVKPYGFTWDFPDPFEEQIGWDFTLTPLRDRVADTIHSLHRKLRSQKEQIARRALELQRSGERIMPLDFPDPLAPFKEAFTRLLPGKKLVEFEERTQNIRYAIGEGETRQLLQLSTLSSGEREVVSLVFDFLLRNPQDCIVVFDEPELHLHPELSYRLLRTLRESGEHNQFIFCTHSADIISASLDHTVVFIRPPAEDENQALVVTEESEASKVLHLLGQSIGVISLGQRIVLIEGEKTSLDKQTYGAMVGNAYPGLVLVPAGGRDSLEKSVGALDTILSRTIWGVDFFVLCDGDSSVDDGRARELERSTGGRLRRLPRYHLENYFLDGRILAKIFQDLDDPTDSWLCDPDQIEKCLRELAKPLVSYAASLRVAHRVRLETGNVDVMPKGCDGKRLVELQVLFETKADNERARIVGRVDPASIKTLVDQEYIRIEKSLRPGSDEWKSLIPGRPVLHSFARKSRMDVTRLKTLSLKAAAALNPDPFAEVKSIFQSFAEFRA